MIDVLNVRLGLATNSSSSHSMIFVDSNHIPANANGSDFGDFGWNYFVASSLETKSNYLACIIHSALRDRLTTSTSLMICKELFKPLLSAEQLKDLCKGGVDHQSHFILPRHWAAPSELDWEFLEALRDFITQKDLVIIGGNDNEEPDDHWLINDPHTKEHFRMPLKYDYWDKPGDPYGGWVTRYDPQYKYWSVFNRRTGAKIRMRFPVGSAAKALPEVTHAFAPELIDIKITNRCPFNCPYCYQGSTPDGDEKRKFDVHCLAGVLKTLKVFEVAIGGGEPTLDPEFINILERFRECGIVPNFSTRNLSWIRDPQVCSKIHDLCGAFAFSVDTLNQLCGFTEALRGTAFDLYKEDNRGRVSVQIVMGLNDIKDKWRFKHILTEAGRANLRVTLLGYKTTGRGATQTPDLGYVDWLVPTIREIQKDSRYSLPQLSVDTVLASQIREQLTQAGVPDMMFHTKDGAFSCYIDAVKGLVGSSSYCNEEEMIPVTTGRELGQAILEVMARFDCPTSPSLFSANSSLNDFD